MDLKARRPPWWAVALLTAGALFVGTVIGTLTRPEKPRYWKISENARELEAANERIADLELQNEVGFPPVRAMAAPTTAATVPPPPRPGSREIPIPAGQPARIGDWELTITGVDADAWPAIRAESSLNVPPATSRQYLMIGVAMRYVGSGASSGGSLSLELVGEVNVVYGSANWCGLIPSPLPLNKVFEGGVLAGNECWTVRRAEVATLVLLAAPVNSDVDPVFLEIPAEGEIIN